MWWLTGRCGDEAKNAEKYFCGKYLHNSESRLNFALAFGNDAPKAENIERFTIDKK